MHTFATVAAFALAVAAAPAAQCTDPPTPTAGFAITSTTDLPIVFDDGYVTKIDVRHPAGAPPPCGWPLVIAVHGGGQSKEKVAGLAKGIAARGFVTVGYDIRGDGSSWFLNDPLVYGETLAGVRERIDMFAVMEATEASFPTLVDFGRIGVTGGSEGGRHSMWAASWSGLAPPSNPWRADVFPTISAVAFSAYAVDTGEMWTPQGGTSLELLLQSAFGTWELLTADLALLQNLFLAEDFAGIRAAMQPLGTELPPAFAASSVPWCIQTSYDDKYIIPYGIDHAFVNGVPGVARRISMATNHHNSPRNVKEANLGVDLRLRWFDRFLKGIANGVDTEPPVRFATTPIATSEYLDTNHLWDAREFASWPLPFPARRLWLDAAGTLAEQAPGAPTASDTLVHTSSIDIATYATTRPTVSELTTSFMPLDSNAYDSAPLDDDAHFLGQFHVQLEVASEAADYQIHAALFDVDPSGSERWVADGFTTVRGSVAPGDALLGFDSHFASYVFRAGHRIRLRLENLVWHRPPTGVTDHIRMLPVFTDFSVSIHRSAARPSYLDVPFAPIDGPSVVASEVVVSDAAPGDVRFAVQDDTAEAGKVHAVGLSLSGTSPGFSLLGTAIALNPDALTNLVVYGPSTPPLSNFVGTLDANARAEATLSWSLVPGLGLAGGTVSAVGLVLDPVAGTLRASPPIAVRIDP